MKNRMTRDDISDMPLKGYEGKTILISGGCGYLASAIIRLLKDTACRIVRLDRPDSRWEEVGGCADLIDHPGNLRDPKLWQRAVEGVDVLFHLAAQTSAYMANDDPPADQAINVMPMLQLLESCRRLGVCPTICFASTVTVAGIPHHLPVDETHLDHPLTVYDLHKQMAEQYLRWYSGQGFVRGTSLRLANLYGPGPASSRSDRGILNQMIRRALAGETLTVYGTGDRLRDYLYVDDAARAFLAAAQHGEELKDGYAVIGSGIGHTFAEAMELIADRAALHTGNRVAVKHVKPPADLSPIEERHFVADSGHFTRTTGWRPSVVLGEGIDLTMEAFL